MRPSNVCVVSIIESFRVGFRARRSLFIQIPLEANSGPDSAVPVEVSPSIPQRLIPHFSVLCWLIGGNARYLNTRLVRGDVSHCNIGCQ